MLTVNTAAESRDLTTLDNALAALASTDTSGQEVLIATLITRASAAVERFCGRVFAREDVTEVIEGSGRVELVLERTPIVSLTSIEIDGAAASDVAVSDREAGLLFVQTGFQRDAFALPKLIQPWPSGSARRNWEVQYIGGYYLPSFTTSVSGAFGVNDIMLPADLEGLVIETVAAMFTEATSERRPAGVTAEKIGDWAASYGGLEGATRLPERVQAELARNWKRISI